MLKHFFFISLYSSFVSLSFLPGLGICTILPTYSIVKAKILDWFVDVVIYGRCKQGMHVTRHYVINMNIRLETGFVQKALAECYLPL
jgi:hypothetical protein